MATNDLVKNPKHYEVAKGLKAIDVIRKSLTEAEYRGFLIGNLLKYRLRAGKKDDLEQDIAKANEYERRLMTDAIETVTVAPGAAIDIDLVDGVFRGGVHKGWPV